MTAMFLKILTCVPDVARSGLADWLGSSDLGGQ